MSRADKFLAFDSFILEYAIPGLPQHLDGVTRSGLAITGQFILVAYAEIKLHP